MDLYRSIVITGGGGMLALALKNVLESRELQHIALDRRSLDVTDTDSLAMMFAEHKPTLLINCAAHTKVDLCEDERQKADAINGYAVGHMAAIARTWHDAGSLQHRLCFQRFRHAALSQ